MGGALDDGFRSCFRIDGDNLHDRADLDKLE